MTTPREESNARTQAAEKWAKERIGAVTSQTLSLKSERENAHLAGWDAAVEHVTKMLMHNADSLLNGPWTKQRISEWLQEKCK
jgi:hypothetical protein